MQARSKQYPKPGVKDLQQKKETLNVSVFLNDQINPITNFKQINYEENEAAPPKMDNFSKSQIEHHGQFLQKNQTLLPEEVKR